MNTLETIKIDSFAILRGMAIVFTCALICTLVSNIHAQANYEVQVYGSETIPKGVTMIEVHSNFTAKGSKRTTDGTLPTSHAFHETLEITHGVNDWFEVGFYVFTSARSGNGWHWVGTHIRPRVRAPEKWKLPVGLSLSGEIGYQRSKYSADTWSLELRPIIDKQMGKWYVAFNPTLERSLKGPGIKSGFEFSPNVKVSYDLTKKVTAGIEYYGAVGPIKSFDPVREQEHQFIPSIDLNLSPKWEFNFGVGVGVTHNTDHLLVKMIVGRRFEFGRKH
jgi:hypothetical protein